MSFELNGTYPPIVTPFDADGQLSLEKLAENIEMWNSTGLSGLVLMGSNGEFPHLDEDEQMRAVRLAAEKLDEDKHLVVGTGTPATHTTVKRTACAAEAGAEAVMIIPPYYYRPRMGKAQLLNHYRRVADESPVPVILYNMPAFSGIDLGVEIMCELSRHRNIIGVKDSSGNVTQMAQVVMGSADDFSVMAGSGSYLLPALLLGCDGGVMALANIAPDECARLYRLAREGRWEEAAKLQQRLIPVNQAVTARYSIPGLKYAMDLLGYNGGLPREPLLELPEDGKKFMEKTLKEANLL